MIRARPPMQHDGGRTLAHPPLEEGHAADKSRCDPGNDLPVHRSPFTVHRTFTVHRCQSSTANASATFRTAVASSGVNGSGSSLSTSI